MVLERHLSISAAVIWCLEGLTELDAAANTTSVHHADYQDCSTSNKPSYYKPLPAMANPGAGG
jgi:hypothetical protein